MPWHSKHHISQNALCLTFSLLFRWQCCKRKGTASWRKMTSWPIDPVSLILSMTPVLHQARSTASYSSSWSSFRRRISGTAPSSDCEQLPQNIYNVNPLLNVIAVVSLLKLDKKMLSDWYRPVRELVRNTFEMLCKFLSEKLEKVNQILQTCFVAFACMT